MSPALQWFVCAECDRVLYSDWTEAAAIAEYNSQFPGHIQAPKVEVCSDCYLAILKRLGVKPRH